MRKFVPVLFAMLFAACVHSNQKVPAYPDPGCPAGYRWVTRPGDVPEHGACMTNAWSFTDDCMTLRDNSTSPAYAYWSCGGGGVHQAR